jgi:hypothetical protein
MEEDKWSMQRPVKLRPTRQRMKFSKTYGGPPIASTVELRQFSLFSISLLTFSHFSFLSRLFLPSHHNFLLKLNTP